MHGVLSPIWLPAATIIGVCQGDKKEQNNNKLMALPYHIGQCHTLCRTPQLPTVFHTTIFSVFLKYFLDTEKYEVS